MVAVSKVVKLAFGMALGLVVATSAHAADLTLKLGHLANETNSWHKASLKFGEEVARLTEGRIAVEVYPNDSLGREIDLINGMQLGTVEMNITGESLQNWAPMAAMLALPYAYKSLEHMDEIATGEIGSAIEAQIIERAQIRPIAYFARGPRNLTTNRPIQKPEDLNGMSMRVPNVPLFVDTWKALGAQPTPMAFSEVFTSLQNGTIAGQENPLALIQSASLNEVQTHLNQTEHVRSWIYLTISEQVWQGLSEVDRAHILEAAKIAQASERQQFIVDEGAIRADLQKKGMTFVEVDQAAFSAKSRDAVINSVDPSIRETVETIFAR